MVSGYIHLPEYGDSHWQAPVDTVFDLPTNSNQIGDVRQALDVELLYTWNGAAWILITTGSGTYAFTDSLVNSGGTVTLVNDSASPGDLYYYGTNPSGVRGYYALPAGPPGTPGSVWYNGSSPPLNTLGNDGDYFLETITGNVYYKVAGVWT